MKRLLPALAAVVLLPLAGCGGSQLEGASAPPSTFKVTGTIMLDRGVGSAPEDGGDCITDGGYLDIREGAQVTVTDEHDVVIALGSLDPGHTLDAKCIFGFTVTGVPEGKHFYSVEVAHRGALQYTRDGVGKELALTLGS